MFEKNGAVYVKTDEDTLKANRRFLNIKCSASTNEKVLVIGGSVNNSLRLAISHFIDLTTNFEQWLRDNRCR